MLEARDLTVSYGRHRALEGARLSVRPGEIVVILGANGAGKSTLLKAVCGICEGQVQGSVTLDGADLTDLPAGQIVEAGIALVPEGRGLFGDLSVEENLTLGAYPQRARGREAGNLERIYHLFPKLRQRRRQVVRTMSGGEQQMAAIGRAMMSDPQILALDEPSLGLSPLLCKELFRTLKGVRALGVGVLMVEQNAKQSLAIADRGYLLENARIVHEAAADALLNDPAVQAAYLGAGGAAAPHTHEEAAPAVQPTAEPADALPPRLVVPPPSRARRSADAVLGARVSDMVSKAAAAARPAASSPTVGAPSDALRAVVDEMARAAEEARRPRAAPIECPLPERSARAPRSPQPSPEPPADPVVIEVYRAPRVEVYRRRPDGSGFERR